MQMNLELRIEVKQRIREVGKDNGVKRISK